MLAGLAWPARRWPRATRPSPEPDVTTVDGAPTSILATTTTKPPECKDLVPASVVFVGTVIGVTGDTARYAVAQVRSGELPATRVQVDYPDDIRFVKEGRQYVVGAAARSRPRTATVSKVRPPRDVDRRTTRATQRDQVYTKNLDGSDVDTEHLLRAGRASGGEIAWAFLLPTLIALGMLTVLVLFRRAGVGAFRLSLRRAVRSTSAIAAARSGTSRSERALQPTASRTPAPPGEPPRR